ncbi:hypothetical protein SCG7086_AK_00220 [Chlamydiales bacterium SCGC AG-110-P3]|nr:hypothetical protein SCG7086_AK_00220 [Chlamydiales bacterium SCGC AG-110-P3]
MTQLARTKRSSGRLYQFLVYGVITLFVGILVFVVFNSNHRKSGKTGQDAVAMQMMRCDKDHACEDHVEDTQMGSTRRAGRVYFGDALVEWQ